MLFIGFSIMVLITLGGAGIGLGLIKHLRKDTENEEAGRINVSRSIIQVFCGISLLVLLLTVSYTPDIAFAGILISIGCLVLGALIAIPIAYEVLQRYRNNHKEKFPILFQDSYPELFPKK